MNFYYLKSIHIKRFDYVIKDFCNLSPVGYSTENIQYSTYSRWGKFASLTNKKAQILLQNQTKQNLDKKNEVT